MIFALDSTHKVIYCIVLPNRVHPRKQELEKAQRFIVYKIVRQDFRLIRL